MKCMFDTCGDLESLDLSGWNVSNVVDMRCMFYYCVNLKSLDLSGWNTSNVSRISHMFHNCPAPYEVVKNKIVKK